MAQVAWHCTDSTRHIATITQEQIEQTQSFEGSAIHAEDYNDCSVDLQIQNCLVFLFSHQTCSMDQHGSAWIDDSINISI